MALCAVLPRTVCLSCRGASLLLQGQEFEKKVEKRQIQSTAVVRVASRTEFAVSQIEAAHVYSRLSHPTLNHAMDPGDGREPKPTSPSESPHFGGQIIVPTTHSVPYHQLYARHRVAVHAGQQCDHLIRSASARCARPALLLDAALDALRWPGVTCPRNATTILLMVSELTGDLDCSGAERSQPRAWVSTVSGAAACLAHTASYVERNLLTSFNVSIRKLRELAIKGKGAQ